MFERYSERARRVIFMALWSARKRGASYIEPEDLLHAVILEDNGEFAVLSVEVFGIPSPIQDKTVPPAILPRRRSSRPSSRTGPRARIGHGGDAKWETRAGAALGYARLPRSEKHPGLGC